MYEGGPQEKTAPAPEPVSRSVADTAEREPPAEAASLSGRGAGPVAMEPSAPPQQAPEQNRLRIYSADLELIVSAVERARERVFAVAEEAGGYVESSDAQLVVIRVPAERFETTLSELEALGEVSSRAVRTADVTDQYADLERRIELAERTRSRLRSLLERTEDAEERVAVLREIRRLTERIEILRGRLQSLDRQIEYSRISVRLTARITEAAQTRAEIPFPWIAALDPLVTTTGEPSSKMELSLPADFAVFDTGRFFRAETASGTQVRIGAVENRPRGDAEFWQRALSYHLRDLYGTAEQVRAGDFRGVLFEAKGARRFSYLVLVSAEEDEILVCETFFPNEEAVEDRLDRIVSAVSEAER